MDIPVTSGFRLSSLQRWLWDRERGSGSARAQGVVRVQGEVDRGRLLAALHRVGERHEILRTSFPAAPGMRLPLQQIAPQLLLILEEADLRGAADPAHALADLCRGERERPLDLAQGPVFLATLASLPAGEHALVLTLPALCADAVTLERLAAEIAARYGEGENGEGENGEGEEDDEPLQFADLCEWQREVLESEESQAGRELWACQIADAPPAAGRERAAQGLGPGTPLRSTLAWDPETARRIAACDEPEAFLTACWHLLLARMGDAPEILTAHRLDGRGYEDLAAALGPLARPLPLRVRHEPGEPFSHAVARTRELLREAAACQHAFAGPAEGSEAPWLGACCEVRRQPAAVEAGGARFRVERRHVDGGVGIDLVWEIGPDGLTAELACAPDTLSREGAERWLRHLAVLTAAAAAAPDTPAGRLPLLGPEDRRAVLEGFQEPPVALPDPLLLHRLFEAQAARAPEAPALAGGGLQMSYQELDGRANQLAHRLLRLGVLPEQRVAIVLERSADAAAALLGVLKVGAAFVALDPGHPDDRLAALAGQAGASLLISSSRWRERVSSWAPATLWMDGEDLTRERASDPHVAMDPDQAAYVAFTSGSTGTPKGVVATHRGVASYLAYLRSRYGLAAGRRVLQLASLSQDAAVRDLLAPLAFGATVVLPGEVEARLPRTLLACARREKVTDVLTLVPSLLRTLAGAQADGPELAVSTVRTVLVSGERLHASDAGLARALFGPGVELVNQYGPTEATMTSTWFPVPEPAGEPVSVGRPIPGSRLYILGADLEPLPPGVTGEVYLGGPGLARGYLGRPDATAAAFLPAPFGEPGERLYRTGDLARHEPDGAVTLLGRADFQLKVRGYRVEPGEVEAVLASHPAVLEAAVVLRDDGAGGSLAAYLVARGEVPPVGELRALAARRLPPFMVPGSFAFRTALPRTGSGKVDRRALAEAAPPPALSSASASPVVFEPDAPAAGLEETLTAVWREVLQVEAVGVRDNFFDLGGHSLLLVKLHARLEQELGRELTLVELLQYPNVRALAEHLSRSGRGAGRLQPPARRAAPVSAASGRGAIAIVGMAGRFPGAGDLDEFWRNLRDGVESISRFSDAELAAAGAAPSLLAHPKLVKAGGVLDGADLFDAGLFGFTPREAEILDPQHRHFLECAYAALEDAACDPDRFPGEIGVFGGTTFSSYLRLHLATRPDLFAALGEFQIGLGAHKDFLTTRVSYKLGLRGPSLDIQTACSTSLVAVAVACQSLLAGQCGLALAGGAAIRLPQQSGYVYQEGGQESSDGHCRAFDARADGSVFGNGVGVVALRRLEDALADGDPVRAVILGAAINNDGSAKVGYTAPSVEGQALVIAAAQAQAGIAPETVSYVEAHGTGTALGDPIEVAALTRAFGRPGAPRWCALGSLKPNIGHLSAAAGVAGLIKAVLALEHRQIPPSLHFEAPNPRIDFERSPFYVNDRLADWRPAAGAPRRAGVSSFGIGGTNAHVVLEEAPERPREAAAGVRPWQVLTLSARTPDALEALTDRLAAHLAADPADAADAGDAGDLADVASTLQRGRRQLEHRRIVVCRGLDDASRALAARHPRRVLTAHQPAGARSLALLFPGLGDHYPGMARGLYDAEPVFREEIDRAAAVLLPVLGCDLREALYPAGEAAVPHDEVPHDDGPLGGGPDLRRLLGRGGAPSAATRWLDRPSLSQPALFAVEYALARLWREWGVVPEAVAGYSLGEYVAACVAGVFSFADALTLVAQRALLVEALPAGAMLAVSLPAQEVLPLLGEELDLAAVNGPTLSVVAGPEAAVAALAERLAAAGTPLRRLPVGHAFHSREMAPAAALLADLVRGLELKAPRIPILSNVTGTWLTAQEATDPAYWARHLTGAVQFSRALETLWQAPSRVLLEVGPGQGLTTLALQHAGRADRVAVPCLRGAAEDQPDQAFLMTALGRLWLAGVEVDWAALHAGGRRRKLRLPTYPFDRKRHWIEPAAGVTVAAAYGEPLGVPVERLWAPVWTRALPRPQERGETSSWLLFIRPGGLGDELAARLRGRGDRVVRVEPAEEFARTGADDFAVRAGSREHWAALLRELGERPARIVHLWALDGSGDLGVEALAGLAEALEARGAEPPVEVRVVARELWTVTGEEEIVPERAALLGCESLGRAFPGLRCPVVDVAVPAGADRRERLLEALIAELDRATPAGAVAYRGGRRWVRSFEPLPVEPVGGGRLRQGATYLLAGREPRLLGELAWHFASRVQAGLVLAGPLDSSLPATLKGLGAKVRTVPVPDWEDTLLPARIARAARGLEPVRGVVCAVDPEPGAPAEPVAATLRKVRHLAAALAKHQPDFVVLLCAVPDEPGAVLQAAARAAGLEALAWQRSAEGATPWTALVWHPGPAGSSAIPAVDALWQALAAEPTPQLAFSRRSPDLPPALREEGLSPAATLAAPAACDRPALTSPYAPPRDDREKALLRMWQELLGIQQLGIHDSFFELGGHSLQGTVFLSRVRDTFQVELPLGLLFDRPTIAELAAAVGAELRAASGSRAPALVPLPRDRDLQVSFAQQRLWLLDRLESDGLPGGTTHLGTRRFRLSNDVAGEAREARGVVLRGGGSDGDRSVARAVFNLAFAVRLAGPLDPAVMASSLQALVDRQEILRTSFGEVDGLPIQRVEPRLRFRMPVVDLGALPEPRREAVALELAQQTQRQPFDLTRPPLLRVRLVRFEPGVHALLLAIHHIVSDGWSTAVLVRELIAFYEAFAAGRPAPLRPLPIQYADYAAWQRLCLTPTVIEQQLGYWRERLAAVPPLEIPADHPRPPVQSYRGAAWRVDTPLDLSAAVQAVAVREKVSSFMVLTAAFNALMTRLTGQDDIVVGTPVANRVRSELEGLIGPFVNLLVMRTDVSGAPEFRELIGRTRDTSLGAYAHGDLPFEQVVEALQPRRDLGRSAFFQVMVNMLAGPDPKLEFSGLTLSQLGAEVGSSLFDLTLYLSESPLGLRQIWEYSTDLFDRTTVARLAGHFQTLLAAAVADPRLPIDGLPLLAEAERQQLAVEWNDTRQEGEAGVLVHELFEAQAARTPGRPAVIFDGEVLTYRELDARANRLAHHLRRLGVGPEVRVGLCVERSAALFTALLGILKAGGAYVPLDSTHPAERLAHTLEDAGVAVLLTEERLASRLPLERAGRTLFLDLLSAALAAESARAPERRAHEDNLAYVIHTSGSTGRPKGVQVPHRSLVSFLRAVAVRPGLRERDVVPALTTLTFDPSGLEIYLPLMTGACVAVISRQDAAEGRRLAARLDAVGATVLQATPSTWRMLLEAGWQGRPGLRGLCGGEALPRPLADEILARGVELWNLYGPTEATVWSCLGPMVPGAEGVRVGRPLANLRHYAVDRGGFLAPAGVPGELWIGGEGVARGYLGRGDLTAEKFVPDPFSGEPGARLYRSGDLARYRENGELEIAGRVDQQVKVRGYRIELAEVESALGGHPGVAAAAVLAEGEPGGRRLVACFVPSGQTAPAAGELRAFLRERLPEPMVPSRFVALEALPLNPSGKVDRKALSRLPLSPEPRRERVAPRTPAEAALAEIWAQLLEVEPPGVDDDFFELGGHSLLASRVLARVSDLFRVDLTLRDFFEGSTLEALAERVEGGLHGGGSAREPLLPRGGSPERAPLSFAQQRLWLVDRYEPGSSAYNLSTALRLRGRLDVAALRRSLNEIVRRHEILRTSIQVVDGEPAQVIAMPAMPETSAASAELPLPVVDLAGLDPERREPELERQAAAEALQPFDLAVAPLLRSRLLRLGDDNQVLVVTLHHIVSDAWSIAVCTRELTALYRAFAAGRPSPLPELPIQYADFAEWQRRWLDSPALAAETAYWQARLAGVVPLELPTDRPRPAVSAMPGAARAFALDRGTGESLLALAQREGVTPYVLLLSAFQTLLHRYTGREDFTVGTPIAGRRRVEVEDLIGFFVNTLVLRADLGGDPPFRQVLARNRDAALEAFIHQDLPFEKLVEVLNPERQSDQTPLFQAVLAFQNVPRERLDLPGLEVTRFQIEGFPAKFDLALMLFESDEGIAGSLRYRTDLFDATTGDRLLGHFTRLLGGVLADPARRLSQLPLLTEGERQQVTVEWHDVRQAGVLDARGNPVPIRVTGELPTGERGRWRPDGTIELLGLPGSGDAALPQPQDRAAGRPFVAPRTALEESLAAIWSEVLGLPVGVDDDFFLLGGHSLLATRILARILETLKVELRLRDLFEARTVAALAVWIESLPADRGFAPDLIIPRLENDLESWLLEE